MEQEMPAEINESARPVRSRRWLAAAIQTASTPLPALPFDRATRSRPASFVPTTPVRPASVAAR
jgi:hypothetical protein